MMRLVLLMLFLCAPGAVPLAFAATPGEVQVGYMPRGNGITGTSLMDGAGHAL
jgi:hypothetical protein